MAEGKSWKIMLTPELQTAYLSILREELVPATGCTEPIALAYAAARLRELLGAMPERIDADISGNIIKNVKSVVVPNTGGKKGIPAAIAAGVVAGDAGKVLQVIAEVPPELHAAIGEYVENTPIRLTCSHTTRLLDIVLKGYAGEHTALVQIANSHSNIVREERDGEVLLEKPFSDSAEDNLTDKSALSVADILEFANTVDLSLIGDLLEAQLSCNLAIAEEGLRNDWGANVGSVILGESQGSPKSDAKAWAAAGSDARMSGCEMPVVILSGSGNQGIAASVPVARYAHHLGASKEKLYRALLVSDLITVEQKSGIGRLSAYCGAVSAAVGSGAAITYLYGGSYEAVCDTITNTIANVSGIVCDGAKPSCAAKIASAVDAAILGHCMALQNRSFRPGDGIVRGDVEDTIRGVGRIGRDGMRETDEEILNIILEKIS